MDRIWQKHYGTIPAEVDATAQGTIVDLLENAVAEFGDKAAFHALYTNLRYSEIDRLSRDFAAYLQTKLSLAKGARVALMMPNLLSFPVVSFGIIRAGLVQVNVNPLYSPTSVLSEGSANYGIDLAFPAEERLAFERDILYPLAGLDPKSADAYWKMQQMTEMLSGARLTIAKMYLDGEISRAQALELTQKYLLLSPARAEQSVAFTDHYRSYVINYGWGKDLVRNYVESGNPAEAERWRRMEKILSEPTLPSDLLP